VQAAARGAFPINEAVLTARQHRAHLELSAQAIDNDVEVEFPHALNDSLVSLLVAREVEGGVLLRELNQAVAHLLQVALALGLDRDLDNRVWKAHRQREYHVSDFLCECLDVMLCADSDDRSQTSDQP
jgi:hypothetical protein